MKADKVLILSDDLAVTDTLKMYLEAERLKVDVLDDKFKGLQKYKEEEHDLVIIDMELDDCDIIQFSSNVRNIKDAVIIILTPEDKQKGIVLEVVQKATGKFDIENIDELLSLVNQQYYQHKRNQCQREENGIYFCDELAVDLVQEKIYVKGEEQEASDLTVKLLIYLIKNEETYKSKKEIYQTVWNNPASENDSTVMAHIRNLRKAIDDNDIANPKYIHTKRGVGYMFKCSCCDLEEGK
ncbi:MAG: winged-helix domain-containing protein [Clostridia bacterium]